MNLFERLFGKTDGNKSVTTYKMITDMGDGFYSFGNNMYKSDIVRACIRPKAKAIGKLVAKHIQQTTNDFKVNPEVNIRFLLEEPNPLMTGQVMQEKLANQLALNNNAFAWVKRDELGNAIEIYPLVCNSVELLESPTGDIFMKFYFRNGNQKVYPYTDIIHLRSDFNEDDIFGDSPQEALASLMEVVNTIDQGVVKAVKNSAVVKWILKFASVLKPDDVKSAVKDFSDSYLSLNNEGGAAAADPRYELQQVKPESYIPNEHIFNTMVQRVYSFFNTNTKIIQSDYTEDQWVAYYEAEIEPVAMQMSGVYTKAIFNKKKRMQGDSISFGMSSLQHSSMQTKLELVQLVDRGAMTPNEWRAELGLSPIEGGNKPIRRLDTALVEDEARRKEVKKLGQNGKKGTDNAKD
ncbi:phage portal protein [Sporosarcina sp. ANT_H38]|uniref:phage portal protein n=1 Tax=Sporosarcina sp. ANT_H38 TaxID=2597358 RepID=UPI0011F1A3E6|nr:phage portal protein [Sporosarcina sp. ANT_H38]KAA0944160.1 phage portal protein [Sporosarcina sp. ANT_H38]